MTLTRRVKGDRRHRVHVRFSDVFYHNGNIKVPGSDRLVVGCHHELSVLIHERDRINQLQMLIIFLCNLSRIYVIL